MLNFRIVSAFLALLFVSIACSKEDHVIPASCKYLGKSYKISYPSGSGEEHNSDVTLLENGLLKEANTSYVGTFTDVSTNIEHSRRTELRQYRFIYDNNGFLTQQIMIKSFLVKTTGNFWYATGFYKELSEVTTETTDFTYDSEKLTSMSLTGVTVFIGDKNSPVETKVSSKRTYQYESGGKPVSYTEIFSNGNLNRMTYKNGVRSSNVFTTGSGYKQTTNYNEMGLVSEDITASATYKLTYDAKGNMIYIEAIINNVPNYKQEYKYDDHPNPETLIPTKFKGIPDPIRTIQSSDGNGTNNLAEEKFTSYVNNPGNSQQYVHSYNISGYPETTTISMDSGQGIISRVTNYKYQDCQ